MKNKTFNKEEILSRLEKSNPEQLEVRLEMKSESSAPPAPKKKHLDSYGNPLPIDTVGSGIPK